ncbi:hypothetical protein [Paraburkholderia sp. GAS334]|uniref:hypothetical protein n=1 Tax=Paraburkholderia sp. GAS334 TaxID=3035131 RepID=UPI003D23A763
MADSADFAASPNSRPRRARSTKPREATVSTETENKLARAARSAQRLAQLSDVPRDDSTLDLFPDDPTRATLEAMTIDVRQGTLTGFELPPEVLAAVGVTNGGDALASDAKSTRRVTRAAKVDEAASLSMQASVLDERVEPSIDDAVESTTERATERATGHADGAPSATDAATQNNRAELNTTATATHEARDVDAKPATPDASARAAVDAGAATASASAKPANADRDVSSQPGAPQTSALTHAAAPELDRARATAFADTVDALYGVIADQRRAATDHSRRMKWMLSIVVAALLVTVAIGITQTMLLMRLTRDSTAQQQRIEQMMLNQQATLSTLLDTDSATVSVPAVVPVAPDTPAADAAPRTAPPATTARRAAKNQHGHKPKTAPSH